MKAAQLCVLALAVFVGAAYADGGSDAVTWPGCPQGCIAFSGACSGLCLCPGPAYQQNGMVWGSSTIINNAAYGWATVTQAYVELFNYGLFVMQSGTTGCVGKYVPTRGGQVTCNYQMTPGYGSPGFVVATGVQASCSTGVSATSGAEVADGQGPSEIAQASCSTGVSATSGAEVADGQGPSEISSSSVSADVPSPVGDAGSDGSSVGDVPPTQVDAEEQSGLAGSGGRKLKM